MMKRTLFAGVAIIAVGLGAQAGADDDAPHSHPAQNIERDTAAQDKARWRDRWRWIRPAFNEGREVRSYDGSGNNAHAPLAGAAFRPFQRMTHADYADDIASMPGALRRGAREISNIVVAQGDRSIPNSFGTSDYLWQWGQFMDHDMTLGDGVPSDDRSHDIPVPAGDPFFDPAGAGDKWIRFDRALYDDETGTDPGNPRQQMNELTSWIDGSMVYGSGEDRALALRTNDGTGRLKTSHGDLLPFNAGGLPNANEGPIPPAQLFVAGDVRSNEQVGLTVMHTLFVREHNRWADHIARTRPWFSDEDIYQAARRMVIAEIQIITYEEFLPALIGERAMPRYRGHQTCDPTIFTEFSGAAYRLGHTLINGRIMRVDRRGHEIPEGHLALRNAFFNAPMLLTKRDDIDPVLRGLAAQKSQAYDNMIVDDLRNFLFGPPGAGGFDLAALNIQRGRDRGIAAYNDVREGLGLGRASDFDDVSKNPEIQARLRAAYGTVDDIDLWVGGISEDPVSREGSQLGPTFRMIVAHQFAMLRDCDRFWWERDLTKAEQAMVRRMRLSDVIVANTGVRRGEIPDNVFYVRGEPKHGGGQGSSGWPRWRN